MIDRAVAALAALTICVPVRRIGFLDPAADRTGSVSFRLTFKSRSRLAGNSSMGV
jgi:hypothetical protein